MTTFVIMAGLPGRGKTTLATALAARLNGRVLSKDEVRAAVFGERLVDYTREQDDLCMQWLISAAQYLARKDATPFIFFDGRTFSRSYQVEQIITAAEMCAARWRILLLSVADGIAQKRIERDQLASHPAKNRDFALYQKVKAEFEPITRERLELDGSREVEEMVDECLDYLTR